MIVIDGAFWRAQWCETHREVADHKIDETCKFIDTAPALWFGPAEAEALSGPSEDMIERGKRAAKKYLAQAWFDDDLEAMVRDVLAALWGDEGQ